MQFSVSTAPHVQSLRERTTRATLLDSAGPTSHSVTIVAPIVEIRMTSDAPSARRAPFDRRMAAARLSLPYHLADNKAHGLIKLVRFDADNNRWQEFARQSLSSSAHLIVADIDAPGKYTVVEAAPNPGRTATRSN